ncbi:hypothetical protein THIOSC13_1910003 [uncultured Thiomicrorhabdus sp.]
MEVFSKKRPVEEEFDYPIYKKMKNIDLVIKFTGLRTGEVIINNMHTDNYEVGATIVGWTKHTYNDVWEDWIPPEYEEPELKPLSKAIHKPHELNRPDGRIRCAERL